MPQIWGGIGDKWFTIKFTLGRIKKKEKKVETCCIGKGHHREKSLFCNEKGQGICLGCYLISTNYLTVDNHIGCFN